MNLATVYPSFSNIKESSKATLSSSSTTIIIFITVPRSDTSSADFKGFMYWKNYNLHEKTDFYKQKKFWEIDIKSLCIYFLANMGHTMFK
ncbi:MAG: hypothetical protein A2X93_02505 [Deltaproteobacteria bacterium GWC2_56_8]|nr:MAG: hypothetical protein A2X93_02505 [Deltaproteobacteria bacterium GWC2_56_8]